MKKEKAKRVLKELTSTTINAETGEVLETKQTKEFHVDGEPDYIKLYLKDITRIFGLPAGCNLVMYELLSRMDYDNLIAVTPLIRKVIAARANTSVDVINHTIAKLVSEGIFTKIGSGTFMANPDLFAKGKWVDIKNLRLSITYDNSGRTFKVTRNVAEQLDLFSSPQAVAGVPSSFSIWAHS